MLTLRALAWLVITALALRTSSYDRLARRWMLAKSPTRRDEARARTIAQAIHRAARLLRPRPSCLTRALAGARMLARDGLDARVTIGVTPGAAFAAHAWLAHGDIVLAGADPDRAYTPLCAIDAAQAPAFSARS
jgi:hypothetical protein